MLSEGVSANKSAGRVAQVEMNAFGANNQLRQRSRVTRPIPPPPSSHNNRSRSYTAIHCISWTPLSLRLARSLPYPLRGKPNAVQFPAIPVRHKHTSSNDQRLHNATSACPRTSGLQPRPPPTRDSPPPGGSRQGASYAHVILHSVQVPKHGSSLQL